MTIKMFLEQLTIWTPILATVLYTAAAIAHFLLANYSNSLMWAGYSAANVALVIQAIKMKGN